MNYSKAPILRRRPHLPACIDTYLMRWIRKKYRQYRLRNAAHTICDRLIRSYPRVFMHWFRADYPLMIKTARAV